MHLKQKAEKETEKIQRKAEHREKKDQSSTSGPYLVQSWNRGLPARDAAHAYYFEEEFSCFLKLFLQAWILKLIAN